MTALLARLSSTWRSRDGSPRSPIGSCGRAVGEQLEVLGLGRLGDQLGDLLDDLDQVEVDLLELQVAGLDLGEVEDVVDDGQQRVAGAADAVGVLALAGVEVGAPAAARSAR